ncbi:hypothetical protein NQ318_010611 [Aromia moschata]|uniref:Uncharacterized protein n=1 Tax=Aromia moschata TaxID=1265417 RepID=A0AAV8XM00_9CUCU|nr:hypothetical protein NQ318_010611 [Aromia moschata]
MSASRGAVNSSVPFTLVATDSVCYGLIYGFLSPYIIHLGANQMEVGILASGNLLCTLVSPYIAVSLIMSIPFEQEISASECDERTVVEKAQCSICDVIQELKNAEYEKNWDIIAMRYLYLCSVIIFSSKFTQLLVANYHSSPFDIGYTSSYMNGLNFAAAYSIESIKIKWLSNIPLPKRYSYALFEEDKPKQD